MVRVQKSRAIEVLEEIQVAQKNKKTVAELAAFYNLPFHDGKVG